MLSEGPSAGESNHDDPPKLDTRISAPCRYSGLSGISGWLKSTVVQPASADAPTTAQTNEDRNMPIPFSQGEGDARQTGAASVPRSNGSFLRSGQPGPLVQSQHQVQVLHRRARSPLAEVVQQGDQPDLIPAPIAEYVQTHPVGAVQPLRIDPRHGLGR